MRNTLLHLIIAGALAVPVANAGIILTFNLPSQSGDFGSTLTFTGSIQNTGEALIYLNGNSINFAAPPDFIQNDLFFTNVPAAIDGLTTLSNIDLFTITISPTFALAPGAFPGLYQLTGGLAGDDSFDLLDIAVPFTVNVNAPPIPPDPDPDPEPMPSEAPEPATFGLMFLAGGAVVVFSRRRKA